MDLTGNWEFKEFPQSARTIKDLDKPDWQKCSVPSSIFNCLITADKIKKTEIEANPENFTWVSKKPWIFRKYFETPQQLLECDRIDLVFDGLDTIATIWLNGKLLTKTNNMFIPHRIDVTKFCNPKNNTLMVKFDPPAEYAKKMMNRYTSFEEYEFENPHRVYIRKAQYQFGWDFCPPLPGCGIWQPLRIEGLKKAKIDNIHIQTIDSNDRYADIKVSMSLDTIVEEHCFCKIIVSDGSITKEHSLTFQPGQNKHSTVIRIHEPALWYPTGYGKQHLYNIEMQLISDNEIIDKINKHFGIRNLKLIRVPDEHGEKFQFEINGQHIYAKGANWIPPSILPGSITEYDYEQLLFAAADANINMLRIWGGGCYENEKFYQLCDKLGIIIWQDFMFACAYYPDETWFTEEIKKEAVTIIKRLRNHPSLVIWCGNNEIDWMHYTGKFGNRKKFCGKSIYHKLLPHLVAELDPERTYIPTTPFSNSKKLNDTKAGTFHQWDIWTNHQPIRNYICKTEDIPRFVAEFGIQSLPNTKTVQTFGNPEKMRLADKAIEKHNYQLDGNSRLYRYTADLFGPAKNLQQLTYLSQLTQARAYKLYIEYLRTHQNRNFGVIFWQFNDCCPAITWSAIDFQKKPKALYYYAKRFFADLLITAMPKIKKNTQATCPIFESINLVAINNTNQSLTATLTCRMTDFFSNTLDTVTLPVSIPPFSVSTSLKLPKSFNQPEEPDKSCLHLVMEKNNQKLAENLFFYLPDKYIEWPKATIKKELNRTKENIWKLKLKSDVLAKDVQIIAQHDAKLTDNFIDLFANKEVEITIDYKNQNISNDSEIQVQFLNQILQNR